MALPSELNSTRFPVNFPGCMSVCGEILSRYGNMAPITIVGGDTISELNLKIENR